MSGPISEVEWVEEVMPLFGKITASAPRKSIEKSEDSNMKMYLVSVIFGAIVVVTFLQVWKQKSENNKKLTEIKSVLESEMLIFPDQSISVSRTVSTTSEPVHSQSKSESNRKSLLCVQDKSKENDKAVMTKSSQDKISKEVTPVQYPLDPPLLKQKERNLNLPEAKESLMNTTTFQVK